MNKYLEDILKYMCKIAGADYAKINFNDNEDPWYWKYKWTEKDQDCFRSWLYNYMKSNKEARLELMAHPTTLKKYLKKFVDEFVFTYGWKTNGSSSLD